MRTFTLILGLSALMVAAGSTPAAASPSSESDPAKTALPRVVAAGPATKDGTANKGPDLQQIMAVFDKLFPPQPDPDPARLAMAKISVTAMWPDNAYGKMMTGFMGGIFDRVMQLKQSDFAGLGPKIASSSSSAVKDRSIHEELAAKDPYLDQRMAAMREAAGEELGKVSAIVDPRIREGLARSMARRFNVQQLTDINAFFATPSGRALASQSIQMWVDPDILRALFSATPEMMKLMPEVMQKMQAANDRFPKPPAATKEAKPLKH